MSEENRVWENAVRLFDLLGENGQQGSDREVMVLNLGALHDRRQVTAVLEAVLEAESENEEGGD